MTRQKRGQESYARGLWAEFLCRLALRLAGYSIVVARYKTPQGEIDIVAARGRALVFIEVKARPDGESAAGAVSPRQQTRLFHAAHAFLARFPQYAAHEARFDVMLVLPYRWPIWHKNAF